MNFNGDTLLVFFRGGEIVVEFYGFIIMVQGFDFSGAVYIVVRVGFSPYGYIIFFVIGSDYQREFCEIFGLNCFVTFGFEIYVQIVEGREFQREFP